ncbi:phage tail protein [Nocardioides rubriscoriae]|uniref:phage tail protein n=1 Tax=Nocardioides rubriscoriae TaxID=642762 RepID=UPI0011DFD1D4|nr:tail fiber protein [Nocardioides rubriscoriae]
MTTQPFIGSLMLVSFGFAPRGFAECNGQLLPINQNQALFSLLGTQYGGNGQTTFALPDLRSRVPVHQGQGPGLGVYTIGETGGAESVALLTSQLPPHQHTLTASGRQATTTSPAGSLMAAAAEPRYAAGADTVMAPQALAAAGGSQPHENRGPSLTLTWVISLVGIFPSRN